MSDVSVWADIIDKVGIPAVLAWFMIRNEKIVNELTVAVNNLTILVKKLCEENESRTKV